MGRKKIAIAPIASDRNRQVTFLKRKQGLFKKCYELSVLCGIDIAVVILTRPTTKQQQPKLYRFASSDVNKIIKRQTEHRGEEDTVGPSFFSGEKAADEDEDNEDDEEPPAAEPSPSVDEQPVASSSREIDEPPRHPPPRIPNPYPPTAAQYPASNYFTYPPPAPPIASSPFYHPTGARRSRAEMDLNRLRGLPPYYEHGQGYGYPHPKAPSSYSYAPTATAATRSIPYNDPRLVYHEYVRHQEAIHDLLRQHPEHMDVVASFMGLEGPPIPRGPPVGDEADLFSMDWPTHVPAPPPQPQSSMMDNSSYAPSTASSHEAPDLDNWINFLGHAPLPVPASVPFPQGPSARELMERLGQPQQQPVSQTHGHHKRRRVNEDDGRRE